ncbi:translation initiation factor IF-2 [bacterium]|nr:translation initiation factor IF-2 [bacterium]
MSKKKVNTNKDTKNTQERVPIVTILGHVDHGKTTILDKIRESNVQVGEAGGITQKVSVFTVLPKDKDKKITFIDTPGHETFDLMRVRGGNIADIVLLIVAADDGVKPQTKESIDIINNSDAKPIVVINKCDLPNINTDKIKREVVNNGLQLEGYGGNIPVVEVSGKTGQGVYDLLNMILLLAEVEGLREEQELPEGVNGDVFVLESVKDKFKGNVSSVVLTNGSLSKGDWFGYRNGSDSYHIERVKGIISEEGKPLDTLECGCGGKIIGLSNLLDLGTQGFALENNDTKLLKTLYKEADDIVANEDMDFDDFFAVEDNKDDKNQLNVIVKSSSEGSLEALVNSLSKLEDDGYTVNIVSSGVGAVTLQDVEFAKISKALILGFEVTVDKNIQDLAKKNRVLIKTYDIIYKLIEEVSEALSMMSVPQDLEEEIGNAQVRAIFTLSDGSVVLGCKVAEGILKKDCKVYIVRNDEMLGESKIKSIRINKDSVTEVKSGFECGVQLMSKIDVREGDYIYCYKKV